MLKCIYIKNIKTISKIKRFESKFLFYLKLVGTTKVGFLSWVLLEKNTLINDELGFQVRSLIFFPHQNSRFPSPSCLRLLPPQSDQLCPPSPQPDQLVSPPEQQQQAAVLLPTTSSRRLHFPLHEQQQRAAFPAQKSAATCCVCAQNQKQRLPHAAYTVDSIPPSITLCHHHHNNHLSLHPFFSCFTFVSHLIFFNDFLASN